MNANPIEPRRLRRGFTLIELLLVITVITILAALTLMAGRGAMITAKKTKTKAIMLAIESGLEKYKSDYAEYPEPSSTVAGITSASAWGSAECLYQALSGDGTDRITDVTPSVASNGRLDDNEKYLIEVKRDWYDADTPRYGFKDGFNHPFQYRYDPSQSNRERDQKNPATYDLWSYGDTRESDGGGSLGEAGSAADADMAKWITNWN